MGNTCTTHLQKFATVLLVGAFSFLNPSGAFAEGQTEPATQVETRVLQLVVGKSQIIDASVPIKRASMANPEVADTVVLSPTQLYVVAKAVGETNLTLWNSKGHVMSIFDLEVIPNLERLREQLRNLLPEEKDIRIGSSHDFVTLSGRVTNADNLAKVLALAEAYAPEKVINFLKADQEDKVITAPIKEEPVTREPIIVDIIKGASRNQVEF